MNARAPATLVLVLHSHQPVGNFDFVFEQAYRDAYAPFLDVLEAHPKIRLGLHYSGILLDWFARRRPEIMERIARLAKAGQVELLTGGFYEPILPIIPDADKIGQIGKLSARLRADFGAKARGAWLAERVWEPSLPVPLRAAGVEYTMLDDTHFTRAGIDPAATFGYYLTEDQGAPLAVFPMNMRLRQLMPFAPVEEVLEYCASVAASTPDPILFMGDDGEKFGNWPGTHHSVYTEGWLDRFFSALEASDWLSTATPSEVLDRRPALGTAYLPDGSYAEMLEWSGGYWRNFFVKYPEANALHKKALDVSRRVAACNGGKGLDALKDELWQGQCNCAYWHGVFGGLYLNHMRGALYEHLIRASALLDRREHADAQWFAAEQRDLDFDGLDEIVVRSPAADVVVHVRGGAIVEFSEKHTCVNLVDTLARRREPYHAKLAAAEVDAPAAFDGSASIHDLTVVKEANLERWLRYDPYRRGLFIDHIFAPGTSAWEIAHEQARDAVALGAEIYAASLKRRTDGATIVLTRAGVYQGEAGPQPFTLAKTLRFSDGDAANVAVLYKIANRSAHELRVRFAVECNFALQAEDVPDRYFHARGRRFDRSHAGAVSVEREREVSALDGWRGFECTLRAGVETEFARYGVYTVSLSEAGIERTYQSTALVPSWNIDVSPGQTWEMNIGLRMVALPRVAQATGQTLRSDAGAPA